MRHIVFSFILLLNFTLSAKQLTLNLNEPKQPPHQLELPLEQSSDRDVVAPVLIKNSEGEAQLGLFTAENRAQIPNSLKILRKELQRQAMHEQEQAKKDGVFKSVNKRFAPESLTFFVAIGLVTYNSMWIKSHGDPLAMERHILSLKDPIAHLSFYAFMQTQGFYMDFHTKKMGLKKMDPITHRQMMTRLSYQGMALGSLASSIVADLGQSVKMCTDKWLAGKTDEKSLESCDQAFQQWTVRSKFTQYFPQIISLWSAQFAAGVIEKGALGAFEKVTATNFAHRFLTKDFLMKTAYKITAADVALTFSGGGLVIKGIKFVGKLTKFSIFVSVDHFLSYFVNRPFNNILKPKLFEYDALAINKLWHEADQGNWDQTKIKTSVEKFEKEIENYAGQMQQWREHLNADAEADLAGWMEMTKEILNQIDYSYNYYRGFVGSLFETLNVNYQIQNKQLAPSAAEVISGYPFRTLPFYGVSVGPYVAVGGQTNDYYLLSPGEIEKRQKEHILNTAKKYQAIVQKLHGPELKELNAVIQKLLSQDNLRMASGLNDLNNIIQTEEVQIQSGITGVAVTSSYYSPEFQDIIYSLKKELGRPQPVVYPFAGYSQAFAANSVNQVSAEAADFSKWSVKNKFQFNKEADLMMYAIICGKPKGSLYKVELAGVNDLSPQFAPPSLLKSNSDRFEFCNSFRTTNDLYSTSIANQKLKDYVLKNLNYAAIGDYTDKKNQNTFETWWLNNAKDPLRAEFKKFDTEYKKLFEVAYKNYFDQRSFFKFAADSLNQSKYLPKSLNASLKAESRLYLQILSRALTADNLTPNAQSMKALSPTTKNSLSGHTVPMFLIADLLINGRPAFDYLEFAKRSSEEVNYVSLYKQTPREIIKLNSMLEAYSALITDENINFDKYIEQSKKIDTGINEILVLVGLKTKKSQEASVDEDLSASATGTENSDNVYEDVPVQSPTYKQRMALAAVKGLKQIESEIRRFIRMRIALSQSLDIDTQEFMKDWGQANPAQLKSSSAQRVGPVGH